MNKRGELTNQIMMVIILCLVAAALIGAFWIVSVIGPIVAGEGTSIANQISTSVHSVSPNTGLDNATSVATNTTKGVLGTFELFVYLGFIGFFLGYLIICYYVRSYPFLAFFWIFIVIFLVFFSMLLSNAYQQAATTTLDMAAFYQSWGTNDFIMNYLPEIIAFMGITGGILLFVLVSREPESEEQLI